MIRLVARRIETVRAVHRRELSGGGAGPASPVAAHARRARIGRLPSPSAAVAPLARRRRAARRAVRDRPAGAPPHDRRQRLLRDGGARIGRNGDPRDGSRRRSRPSGAPLARTHETCSTPSRSRRRTPRHGWSRRSPARSTRGSTSASPPACSCPSTGTISFRHELARLSIEESIPPARTRSLHRRRARRRCSSAGAAIATSRGSRITRTQPERGRPCSSSRPSRPTTPPPSGRIVRRPTSWRVRSATRSAMPPDELALLLTRHAHECYLTDQAEDAIAALRKASASYRDQGDPEAGRRDAHDARQHPLVPRPRRGGHAGCARLGRRARGVFPPDGSSSRRTRRCRSSATRPPTVSGARQWATRAHDLASAWTTPPRWRERCSPSGVSSSKTTPSAGRERVLRARALAEQSGLEAIAAETYLTLGEIEDGLTYCHEHGVELIELYLDRRPRGQRARAWPLDRGDDVRRTPSSDDARSRRSPPRSPSRCSRAPARAEATRTSRRCSSGRARWPIRRASSDGSLPVAVASAEAAWLRGDTAAARAVDGRSARPRSSHRIARRPSSSSRRGGDARASTSRRWPRPGSGPYALELAGDAAGSGSLLVGARPAVRGGTRPGGRRERGSPPRVARHTGLARRTRGGVRRGAPPAATRRSRRPARPSALDALERRRAHSPGARRPRARLRRAPQRRDRRAAVPLRPAPSTTTSRRSSASSTRGRAARRSPSPVVSGCSKTGSADAKPR